MFERNTLELVVVPFFQFKILLRYKRYRDTTIKVYLTNNLYTSLRSSVGRAPGINFTDLAVPGSNPISGIYLFFTFRNSLDMKYHLVMLVEWQSTGFIKSKKLPKIWSSVALRILSETTDPICL